MVWNLEKVLALAMRTHTQTLTQVVKSCHLYFYFFLIYTALFTVQIVSKQLHSDNMKIIQQSLFL